MLKLAYLVALKYFSTTVRMDYPANFTKLIFGGFPSTESQRVISMAVKSRSGNNEGLEMLPMANLLNEQGTLGKNGYKFRTKN